MKYVQSKLVRGVALVVLFVVIVFVAMNATYFYKQINFFLNKPKLSDSQTPVSDTQQKGTPRQINIPSLGIVAPIVEAQISEGASATSIEKDFQEALKTGVVHYPGTAEVGQFGNAYYFGHSSDLALKGGDYKTVFALLPHIEKGAEIIVSDYDGQLFYYVVTDSFVASSTDVYLLDQKEFTEKLLTLQTSYPVGTALKRWIVTAKLKE